MADRKAGLRRREYHRTARQLAFATGLTGVAGYLDAIGFAELNNLFVSFMSGNTTRLGTAIANGDLAVVGLSARIIGAFLVGAALGGFISVRARHVIRRVLQFEIALLAAACALLATGWTQPTMLIVAAAMGLQNACFLTVSGAIIGRTFLTGAVVSFGQGLGRALAGRGDLAQTMVYAMSWLAFIGSVAIGAAVWHLLGLMASLMAAAGMVAVLLVLGWSEDSRTTLN